MSLDIKTFDVLATFRQVQKIFMEEKKIKDQTEPFIDETDEEEIEAQDHRTKLLNLIKSLPSDGFERLSQRLLRESGFQQVVVTGKTGDGGIDGVGVLQVNPFVSFNVLFQCKRYQGAVTPSHVRDFRGAMMGRADKGIIVTTGTFTLEAKKEARRDGVPPIELVDGEALVQMFERLELGLVPRTTYDVDEKFFEDFKK
jgi:restriction system protein